MKSRLAFLAAMAFAGLLYAAPTGSGQGDLLFRGVVGVSPAEATMRQEITVQVRDLDGWVLDEIKQKHITGEGYFTGNQFDTFLQIETQSEIRAMTYGDMLSDELDAIDSCDDLIHVLNAVIGHFKDIIAGFDKSAGSATPASSVTTTAGQPSGDDAHADLLAAEKKLSAIQIRFANLESIWSNGAILNFKASIDTNAGSATPASAAATTGQPSRDLEEAFAGLEAAEKEMESVKAVLNDLESTWYSGWQAWQGYKAVFRAVCANLYLVLDDSRLVHVKAQNPFIDIDDYTTWTSTYNFVFELEKDPNDRAEWEKLYRGTERHIPVALSLAFNLGGQTYTLDSRVHPLSQGGDAPVEDTRQGFFQQFTFVTYGAIPMFIGWVLVMLALLVLIWLARETEMLRDPCRAAQTEPTFSLARCQTAFWFSLFTAAFVYLWVVKGQTDTLTDQCLVLLGISTGATIGTALISEPVQSKAYHGKLRPTSLKRFFSDLLSDNTGQIAFYRFQTLIWTLVLGLVFIKSVYSSLKMAEFSTNELTLMGISAGTYVGFKFPESKAQAAKPQDPAQPAEAEPSDQTPGSPTA